MKKVRWMIQLLLLLVSSQNGSGTSFLCGRTKTMELGGGTGTDAALALTLVRPRLAPSENDTAAAPPAPCKLRISAPNAAAFLVRLIDVKESLLDTQLSSPILSALGGATGAAMAAAGTVRKWSARTAAPAQDTAGRPAAATPTNRTEPCTLSIYIADLPMPAWRLALCGGQAASVAARAGSKLLPPRILVVWTPPASPHHHTEKLRLVVTVVNSGGVCNSSSQLRCGALDMCVASSLECDGLRHCPGGEDEDASACARRREPPLLVLLRRLTARNQELLGVDGADPVTKPSVIMKIGEKELKTSPLYGLTQALKPYGPWGYIMIGTLLCAFMIMILIVYDYCCRRYKPTDDNPLEVPTACVDLTPSVPARPRSATPPAYEPPPSYSSLFPRAFKSSPTPVPHCSHETPPD